jgi:hypothetical protein
MANDLTTSQAEKNKQPYILLWKYEKLYEEKYGKKPLLNKFRDKMNMKDVIESVGFEKAMDLINYYFSLEKFGHPLQFFYYNFDKMEQTRIELQKDIETRRLLRENTKKMVEEGGL